MDLQRLDARHVLLLISIIAGKRNQTQVVPNDDDDCRRSAHRILENDQAKHEGDEFEESQRTAMVSVLL